jgi:hypothetical protein
MKPQPIRDAAALTLAAFVGIFAAILDWPLTAWARKPKAAARGVPASDGGRQ